MDKPSVCIEVTSNSLKLLVGFELAGQAVALYHKEIPLPGILENGKVKDEEGFVNALKSLRYIVDDDLKIKMNITECSLVLPPVGLQIFQNDKATNVVSSTNEIAKIDIANVISLVKKEPVPNGLAIVDIIPDEFVLETGERYSDPPLGKKSQSLMIKAKIHTLPADVPATFERLFLEATIYIRKKCVSTYCLSLLHASYDDLPKSYVMVDIGAKVTTVSLVGRTSPYVSSSFFMGGDDLTDAIAEAFGVSFEEAEKLKRDYGYDLRPSSYQPPIAGQAEGQAFTKKELNSIIESHFESFGSMLTNAIASMLSKYKGHLDNLPLIFTGGGSALVGIRDLLAPLFPNRELFFARPRSIGARDYGQGALLGLIIGANKYTGALEDNYRGMGSVSRVQNKNKRSNAAEVDTL